MMASGPKSEVKEISGMDKNGLTLQNEQKGHTTADRDTQHCLAGTQASICESGLQAADKVHRRSAALLRSSSALSSHVSEFLTGRGLAKCALVRSYERSLSLLDVVPVGCLRGSWSF